MTEFNIKKLYEHLQVLNAVGINRCSIEPVASDHTRMIVSGVNDDYSLIIYDQEQDNVAGPLSVGIFSVSSLLNRLALFDLDKVEVDVDVNGTDATKLTIKEGRRKATYSFVPRSRCETPSSLNRDKVIFSTEFTKDTFQRIQKAIQSMRSVSNKGSESFSFEKRTGGDIYLKLHDGVSDTYEEKLLTEEGGDNWSCCWRTKTIETVMKESLKHSEEETVEVHVGKRGLGTVKANGLTFCVIPFVAD